MLVITNIKGVQMKLDFSTITKHIYSKYIYIEIIFLIYIPFILFELSQIKYPFSKNEVINFCIHLGVVTLIFVFICLIVANYRKFPKYSSKAPTILFVIRSFDDDDRKTIQKYFRYYLQFQKICNS